ncbi:MAG: pseudouridine synthase [Patescibacteria group bacterium]|nr:pseudouridine synthase [Patescibacteria group bacterium]
MLQLGYFGLINNQNMRLNKFIAQATGISRRKADELIANGKVSINDHLATLGDKVEPFADNIFVHGQEVFLLSEQVVFALHKPAGFITSNTGHTFKDRLVYELLPKDKKQLRYAGRLDKDTSGLLIFTNNGELIENLTHPRFAHEKEYLVQSAFAIRDEQVKKLKKGVNLDGELVSAVAVILKDVQAVSITVTEGRKRLIRKMCDAVGIKISELVRVRIGSLRLSELGLGEGEGRVLREKEIAKLLESS